MKILQVAAWLCGVALIYGGFVAHQITAVVPPGGFHSSAGSIP